MSSQGDRQWQSFSRRVKCHAHRKDGQPCQRWAERGQMVCTMHGAASPQARKSARERLSALVEPALDGLHKALESGDTRSAVAAARAILDRAGYPAARKLEIERHQLTITQSQAQQIADYTRHLLADLGVDMTPDVLAVVRRRLLELSEEEDHVATLPPAEVQDPAGDAVEDAEVVEDADVR